MLLQAVHGLPDELPRGSVGRGLGPANVLHGLEDLKVHGLGAVAGLLTEILTQLAGPSKRALAIGFPVADIIVRGVVVVQVLLVGQVAELVRGRHLELVVLQWRQHQRRVLKENRMSVFISRCPVNIINNTKT